MEKIIQNVKIINFDNVINNADIEILNGKIKKIIPKKGKSKFIIIPGFVDLHIHGSLNKDVMEGKKSIEFISKYIVKFGTTSFLPTLMTASKNKILNSLKESSKAISIGSKIIGLHIEGPWISKEKKGAHKEKFLYSPTLEDVKEFQKSANGKLIRIDFAPEICGKEIIEEMLKQKIVPVVGHTNANFDQANKAFENGATSSTHTWNAMSGINARNPGATLAALTNKQCFVEIIPDFIHLKKEIINFSIQISGIDKIISVTDSICPAGMPNGEYVSGGQLVVKKDFKITLKKLGNIAGGASMMSDLFKNLLLMNYSPSQAVQLTSYNAAKNHGLEKQIAYIKEDYYADLIIYDNNLKNIQKVFVNGIEKYNKNIK